MHRSWWAKNVRVCFLVCFSASLMGCGTAGTTSTSRTGTPVPERAATQTLPQDCSTIVHYVAMGDSTVAGVGASNPGRNYVSRLEARLRTHYPRAELTNLGVGGATSGDVLHDQLPRAVGIHPQLVTLSVGPNDITGGFDASQYERSLEEIFQALRHDTRAVVVMNLLPDMAVSPRFTAEQKVAVGRQTVLFNHVIAALAQRYGVQVVDLYTPSQQDVPSHPELLAGDRYHPSDDGYARWAQLMWAGVEARIAARC